jgi:hypothetical protein
MKALLCVCYLQIRRPEDFVRFGGFDDLDIEQIMETSVRFGGFDDLDIEERMGTHL